MRKILNLTQHVASKEQKKAGVFEPVNKEEVQELLTFEEIPDREEIRERALKLAILAEKELQKELQKATHGPGNLPGAMIGGAPYLMSTLEGCLRAKNIIPLYAFSKRMVKEEAGRKVSYFKHDGFIRSPMVPF